MMNNLNKTVAAMLSTNDLLGWLLQFNTPVGDTLWLEGDPSFVKTENKVISNPQGLYVREDAMFFEKTDVDKKSVIKCTPVCYQ